MCSAVQGEGSAVHEGPQVVVLVEVGDPFLQLVRVEEWFDVGDLEVGLKQAVIYVQLHKPHPHAQYLHQCNISLSRHLVGIQFVFVHWIGVLDDFNSIITKPL